MSRFLLNKWANGPQIWGQFRHKNFLGGDFVTFWQNYAEISNFMKIRSFLAKIYYWKAIFIK